MAARNPDVKYASFDQGAAGSTTLVAAPGAGKKIVLKSIALTMSAGGTAQLRSAGNNISGAFPIAANGGLVLPPSENEAWTECNANEALNLFTVTGLAKGLVSYVVDPG